MSQALDFGIFFFSSDGSGQKSDKYQMLLDCARFADRAGFRAVWIPERHFQEFGGLYPNPSVLAAALAMVTERIQIRAGSVVLPLHNPIRVAEEWALVDNLSGGRVGMSFATGWHKRDFALAPDAYAERHAGLDRRLQTVLKLWSGHSVDLQDASGETIQVRTFPRPLQQRLTFWLTGGSEATWEKAARLGANVLCLIRPSLPDLAASIVRYRERRAAHGHDPATGVITVMLHTYLHERMDIAKERVRGPLRSYLESYIAQFAEPPTAASGGITRDDLLDFAFERYFSQSSLLGTPDKCRMFLHQLIDAGVNEVACLLDFGLPSADVLEGLSLLDLVRASFAPRAVPSVEGAEVQR